MSKEVRSSRWFYGRVEEIGFRCCPTGAKEQEELEQKKNDAVDVDAWEMTRVKERADSFYTCTYLCRQTWSPSLFPLQSALPNMSGELGKKGKAVRVRSFFWVLYLFQLLNQVINLYLICGSLGLKLRSHPSWVGGNHGTATMHHDKRNKHPSGFSLARYDHVGWRQQEANQTSSQEISLRSWSGTSHSPLQSTKRNRAQAHCRFSYENALVGWQILDQTWILGQWLESTGAKSIGLSKKNHHLRRRYPLTPRWRASNQKHHPGFEVLWHI